MHQLGTEISNSQSSADICSELGNFRWGGGVQRHQGAEMCDIWASLFHALYRIEKSGLPLVL